MKRPAPGLASPYSIRTDAGDGVSGSAVSASWLADSGLNLTASYGTDDRDGDPSNIYFKLGYRQGDNAWAIDWSETSDLGPGDANSWSVAGGARIKF